MTGASKGEQRRTRKRRARATAAETKAFRYGAEVTRKTIGPDIWRRAVTRALPIGFVIGFAAGAAFAHYVLG